VALPLTFLGAIAITGALGVLAARACVKPLAKAPPLMTLLATLSLGLVIREAILIFYPRGADPKPFPSMLPEGLIELGGVVIRYENLAILAIAGAAMVAVDRIITRTRMGAAIRAVAQDPEAAQMMGVNLDRTVDVTFFLGSGLAAVAGILNGLYYSEIHFVMGIMGGVIGFSAAAIGGLGNVYGAIVGGLLFGVLQTLAAAFIPRGSEFRDVVAFAVVMVFMVVRPTGILGEKPVERV
jgi:branched-chain amino acid transport system permease protein